MRQHDERPRTTGTPAPQTGPAPVRRAGTPAASLLRLQRAAGNRATIAAIQRMMEPEEGGGEGDEMDEEEDLPVEQRLPVRNDDPRQPGIAQFLGGGAGGPAPPAWAPPTVLPQPHAVVRSDTEIEAWIGGTRAGTLTLYCDLNDDNRYYLNNIETDADFRRRGVARCMIVAGIARHGAIYAMEGTWDNSGGDTRGLTADGAQLAHGLVADDLAGFSFRRPEHDDEEEEEEEQEGDEYEGDQYEGDQYEGDQHEGDQGPGSDGDAPVGNGAGV